MFSLLRSAPRSLSSSRLLSTLPPHLLPGSTVAVTGASGYLGSFVTAELLSRGFKVTAAVRTKEECAHLQKLPNASDNLTVSTGCDLLSPGSYDEAFSGAQGVVHMAAVVALGVGQDIVDLSVEGTRNVLESLDKAKGVKVSFSFVCLLLEGAVGCYKGFSLYLLAKLGAVESDAAHVSCLESNSYCSPFFRPFVLSSFLFSLPLPLSHSHSLSLSLSDSSPPQHYVHTSSCAAIQTYDVPLDHVYTEADWNEWATLARGDGYGVAKTAAERVAAAHFAKDPRGRSHAAVNPNVAIGPVMTKQVKFLRLRLPSFFEDEPTPVVCVSSPSSVFALFCLRK